MEAVGNQLEFRGISFGKREEFANVGLPVYYGPDKELINVVIDSTENE